MSDHREAPAPTLGERLKVLRDQLDSAIHEGGEPPRLDIAFADTLNDALRLAERVEGSDGERCAHGCYVGYDGTMRHYPECARPGAPPPTPGRAEMALQEYFDSLPTASVARGFNHDTAFGVVISFVEAGFGFGEITFAVDKATGEVSFDDESMDAETCGRICARLATSEGEG